MDLALLGAVAVPFAAAAATLAFRRAAELWTAVAALATVPLVASLLPMVRAGGAAEARVIALMPGVDLFFRADALGLTFALLASGLWAITSVYSFGYARAERLPRRPRFYACFAASIGAALGVSFAGNLLTFLIFYEILTVATWPLVAHFETREAVAAGRRYLAYALTGGLALTAATAWTWALTGTLDFAAGGMLPAGLPAGTLSGLFALFLFGCGIKAAIMPLHAWLPAAMVAPTPVSALLHAVAVVKAGVFGCLRVIQYVFGPAALSGTEAQAFLLAACGATILAGSFMALRQDHLKKRLAYSTVVHLSLIVFGAALLTPAASTGAALHMVNHGFGKITLFFCAGAIHAAAHAERIEDLAGLARRMPWTFGAFAAASMAMIGVPGLCGFVGKLFIARGAADAAAWTALGVVVGSSLLTAAYLLPILRIAYGPGGRPGREAPGLMVAPLLATAALTLVFGLIPAVVNFQFDLAAGATARVFGAGP